MRLPASSLDYKIRRRRQKSSARSLMATTNRSGAPRRTFTTTATIATKRGKRPARERPHHDATRSDCWKLPEKGSKIILPKSPTRVRRPRPPARGCFFMAAYISRKVGNGPTLKRVLMLRTALHKDLRRRSTRKADKKRRGKDEL